MRAGVSCGALRKAEILQGRKINWDTVWEHDLLSRSLVASNLA